jgi:hypothetical protein
MNLPRKSYTNLLLLALYQGLRQVAQETNNASPRIVFTPLETEDLTLERIKEWFRYMIEVRNSDGAERALLTAIQMGRNAFRCV